MFLDNFISRSKYSSSLSFTFYEVVHCWLATSRELNQGGVICRADKRRVLGSRDMYCRDLHFTTFYYTGISYSPSNILN